jgi:hypothetical protein
MWGLTTSCRWLRSWMIDRRLIHHHHHHGNYHPYHQQHQYQHQQYEDPTAYEDPTTAYHMYNVFDVSASSASSTAFPTHFPSSSSTTNHGGGAGSQPSSLHDTIFQLYPPGDTQYDALRPPFPFLPSTPSHAHITRHTPSPASLSRSRSCPPSSGSTPPPSSSPANGAGGMGSVRTTRTRRNNGISRLWQLPASLGCSPWTWEAACDCDSGE